MTQREIARLACKVLAVWALFDSLKASGLIVRFAGDLMQASQFGWTSHLVINALSYFVWPLTQVVAAIWLWKRAGVVGAWMVGHTLQDYAEEPDATPLGASLDEVQSVVLSSIGVLFLLQVVPPSINAAALFLFAWLTSERGSFANAGSAVSSNIWTWIAQFALGIWLIFGSPGIVRMLKRFRYVGLEPNERPPAEG